MRTLGAEAPLTSIVPGPGMVGKTYQPPDPGNSQRLYNSQNPGFTATAENGVPILTDPATGEQYCPVDPSDYGGPDCNTDDLLKNASDALKALSMLLSLAGKITDAKAKADFEKAVKDAQRKITDGQNRMIDASNKINEATNGLNASNSQINSLMSELSNIQNSMNLELSNISFISGALSSVNADLASANASLAQAQQRYNDSLNRANYPAGFAGLQQMRADGRAASLDMFNLNGTIASLNSAGAEYMNQLGTAQGNYNNLIPQANAVRDGVSQAYQIAQQYQSARDAGAQQWNQGVGTVKQGYGDFMNAGQNYQNIQQNFVMPMVEGATGSSGLSKALNNFAQGNNFSAVGDLMNAGLESGLRNAGTPTLNQFGGMWGTMLSTATQSADQTIRQGGNLGDYFKNVAVNGANALLGAQNFIQVGQAVNQAYNFARADDWSGVGQVSSTITSNLVMGAGAVAGSALPLTPLAPFTPVVQTLTPATATAVGGATETMVQMAQTPFSQPLTPGVTPRTGPGERGLVTLPNGVTLGQPSALTVGLAGGTITAYNTAQNLAGTLMGNNQNLAVQASVQISDMAHSGTRQIDWGSKLRPGEVTLGPARATPVGGGGIGTVIGGP